MATTITLSFFRLFSIEPGDSSSKPALNKYELQFDYFSDNIKAVPSMIFTDWQMTATLVFLEDDLLRSVPCRQASVTISDHHTQSRPS